MKAVSYTHLDVYKRQVLYDPYETAVVTPDPALAERLRAK